jgi:predicted DNA-binding transcriptional regulator AlpA
MKNDDELQEVLTLRQLELFTGGLKRSGIEALIKRGLFPQAVKLGERRRAWLKPEILQWQRERIALARGGRKRAPDDAAVR